MGCLSWWDTSGSNQWLTPIHFCRSMSRTPRIRRKCREFACGDRLLPHWLSWDPDGHRLIVADSGAVGGERRLRMVTLDATTGQMEIDRRFGNPGSEDPGFSFDLPSWPHGVTGPGVPHGTVFVP